MEEVDYDAELQRILAMKEERERLEIEKAQAEAYGKARAESETRALTGIVNDTNLTLQTKLNTKVANYIEGDVRVNEKIEKTAEKLVDKGLAVQDNKATASIIDSEDEVLEADFKKYRDEYLYHGIDHKIDKKWKKDLIMIINDIWFVIWAIVGCFTLVPVSTFLSRIKALSGFIKGVAIVIGVVLLLLCLWGLTVFVLNSCGVNIFN